MSDAYQNAMRTVADTYEAEVASFGGRSLSRVSTIVASNGTFFERLRQGKPFYVHNLERFAEWFRQPSNWPMNGIPAVAQAALASMGRPAVDVNMPHRKISCAVHRDHAVAPETSSVRRDRNAVLRSDGRA